MLLRSASWDVTLVIGPIVLDCRRGEILVVVVVGVVVVVVVVIVLLGMLEGERLPPTPRPPLVPGTTVCCPRIAVPRSLASMR